MDHKNTQDLSFQFTVGQLTLVSQLPKQDIRVTIALNDTSKITCSGEQSEDGLIVIWNHSFLFSAPSNTSVRIAIWVLPEELTHEWDKQPLGDPIITNIAMLMGSDNTWQCDIPGLSTGSTTLSIQCKATDVLLVPNGHNCLSALQRYAKKLCDFGRVSKNVVCTTTGIEMELARLDLCPLGHANHLGILNSLAIVFTIRYDQEDNITDLNRSIDLMHKALELCPLGHPKHVTVFGNLVIALARHYRVQRHKKDLDKIMDMEQTWLDLCPLGHPDHKKALGTFAASMQDCYLLQKDITDLNKAIQIHERRLELCSAGHPDHDVAMNNLANCLRSRYQRLGNLTDLNKAIELQEKCLELWPPGHQQHGIALANLATSFKDRFDKMANHSDLVMATNLFKKALHTYPVEHSMFAKNISLLAKTILLPYRSSSESHPLDQPLPSINEAFETYRLLKKCGPAVSLCLWQAAQAWVQDAEEYNHPSVLEAYQTSLNTLDHFTSFNASLESRHETMQARMAQIANDAFSCAIRHGHLQMAVEFLEQGRGILWNQLARFDISIGELECPDKELTRKFTRLSADLRKHAQRSVADDANPYWQVQEEWQRVVDEIRSLDGFSRFLLPPRFDDLQRAAEHGPVIIVNASRYGCDVLIVLHTVTPIHVPLRCVFDDVVELHSQLSELTQSSHAYGRHREQHVKGLLRDLWCSVVERIVSVLRNDVQLPLGSRIWWCQTSKFTLLPFHAAGPYRNVEKNLMDIYVSSYAPSLSALLRARDRLRSQRESHRTSGIPDMISFAAVGQARPSTDTNMSYLPEVEHEIQRIRNETNMPSHVKFEAITNDAASIEGAVHAFRDHRWVHVACHGAQHATKPFDSWFAMGDGKLTLMRIIQERYTNSEFAFLSACHTAVGDASTPDEVLHLAAGMQFAGFNGVIGTLWRVDDAIAHQVVTRFYKEMFSQPTVDFEHAAAALNTAAVETANEISLEKRIVFVHIGI